MDKLFYTIMSVYLTVLFGCCSVMAIVLTYVLIVSIMGL